MPLPGTHAARQIDPGKCKRVRTERDALGRGVTALWCVNPGEPVAVQSVHFDAKQFTAAEARDWLKQHGFSAAEFEEAAPEPKAAAYSGEDCPMGKDCPMRQGGAAAAACLELAGPPEIRAAAGGLCEFDLEAKEAPGGPPRVSMLAYTGVPMRLEGFHLPVVVDLESLKVPRQSVPILRGHDAGRIAGHTIAIEPTAQRLKAAGVLSGMPEHTADLLHTAGRGFPWQVSIGASRPPRLEHVREGESVKVNGRNWQGPLLAARGAVLREVSLLPMGADGSTDAAFEAGAEGG